MVEEENRYGKEMNGMGYYPYALMKEYDLGELPNSGMFLNPHLFSQNLKLVGLISNETMTSTILIITETLLTGVAPIQWQSK